MCKHHMSRRRFIGLVPGLVLVASGCGQPTSGPVEVKWGRDTCDYCGMVIDEPRFAAQLRAGPTRKVYKFDDLGDAVLFLAKQDWADHPDNEVWVGDMDSGKWIDGLKAFYLGGQRTPMAHGFGALSVSREGTQDYTRTKGAILRKGSTSRCEPTENPEARG
jgi:copper chaperone NosL